MNLRTAFVVVSAIVVLAVVGHFDRQDEALANHHYCEMVELFNQYRNLPPADRPGWPGYRRDIDCRDLGFSRAYAFSK